MGRHLNSLRTNLDESNYMRDGQLMDYILELILKNEDHQLDKILSEQATKRGLNPLELTMKNFKEMFVFASFTGSVGGLTVFTKYGG